MLKRGIRINAICPGPTDTPLAQANKDAWLGFGADYRAELGIEAVDADGAGLSRCSSCAATPASAHQRRHAHHRRRLHDVRDHGDVPERHADGEDPDGPDLRAPPWSSTPTTGSCIRTPTRSIAGSGTSSPSITTRRLRFWTLSRHADVFDALQAPDLFISGKGVYVGIPERRREAHLGRSAPDHDRPPAPHEAARAREPRLHAASRRAAGAAHPRHRAHACSTTSRDGVSSTWCASSRGRCRRS